VNLLDVFTFLAYVALSADIFFQIGRIYHTKSSHDLSLTGLLIRYAAILVILYKFVRLDDMPLIVGQVLLTTTFTVYLTLAFFYFAFRKRPRKKS